MSVEQLIVEYGIAGAVIIIVIAFLRYLKSRDDIQAGQRDKFLESINRITDGHDATIREITERHERSANIIAVKAESSSKEISESLQKVCIRLEHCPNRDPNGRFTKAQRPNNE